LLEKNVKVGLFGAMKSQRINVWRFSSEIGAKAENMVRKRLETFITKVTLKQYDFNLYPEIQRAGIDQIGDLKRASFDIKSRLFYALKYSDILIELKTGSRLGWFYTSKSDFIAYVIFNKRKTDLVKGWLISLQNTVFRKFIKNNLFYYPHKCAKSERNGSYWNTENLAIPLSDFPTGTLFPFIFEKGKRWGENRKIDDVYS